MIGKSMGMLSQAFALSAFTTLAALALPVQAIADDTSYDFSGGCSDCQNTGNGVLTLQNYTPGTALSGVNFVSFIYSSNLLTFNITQSELDFDTVGTSGTSPYVSGPINTSIGLSGDLGTTTGPANFYLNASTTQGNANYSVNFDTCTTDCGSGLTSPNEWQVITAAVANSQLPGGLQTKVNDYGFSHTWTPVSTGTAVAAPEIDASSAVGALTLLMSALTVWGGRRSRFLRPTR